MAAPSPRESLNTCTAPARRVASSTTSTAIRPHTASVTRRWLQAGASGWRMDVGPWVPDDFWREWRSVVKATDPQGQRVELDVDPVTGDVLKTEVKRSK